MTGDPEYQDLIQFMYQAPVGLMQTDLAGNIRFSTPMAAQLLLPLSPTGGLDNIFDALDRTAPELRNSVISFKKKRGRIVTDHRCLAVTAEGESRAALAVTIVKLGPERLAVSISDIRSLIARENEAAVRAQIVAAMSAAAQDTELCLVDDEGRIFEWSDEGDNVSGHRAVDVIGQPFNVLVVDPEEKVLTGGSLRDDAAPDQTSTDINALLQRAETHGAASGEGLRRRKNGERFWAETTVTRLVDASGAPAGFSVITRDVGDERARERRLIELASLDPLTGALNRRAFIDAANAHRSSLVDSDAPFSVVIADIDHFKKLNDAHGHAVGDAALKAIVAATKEHLSGREMIARFGGEEFVFMLPGVSLAEAPMRAETLRASVEAIALETAAGVATFTASFGVAAAASADEPLSAILERADESLYAAKTSGRNRVVAASGPEVATKAG